MNKDIHNKWYTRHLCNEIAPKQPQEPPKLPRFVDMDSDDTDDEQE